MTNTSEEKTIKKTFWGAFIFYFLITFEFFYMAAPFAVYFYAVYRPVLDFFNQSQARAWVISFFMPHFSQTTSAIVNIHNIAGAVLAGSGFLIFCFGACQIYYHKLTRNGVVTGGFYNLVRHPQYASFIICSFGLLLLWPRFIVLMMYITMLFVYYLLARAEERECENKYGQSYLEYKNKTGMFLPFKMLFLERLVSLPKSWLAKSLALFVVYILVLSAGLCMAKGLQNLTLNSFYDYYTSDSSYVSVSQIEQDKLENIIRIGLADKEVQAWLHKAEINPNTKYLNYVLPIEWYVPEIPMNAINGMVGHKVPTNYDRNKYKIIFNKAEIRANQNVSGKDIILNVVNREPVVEVWINVAEQRVVKLLEMPENIRYKDIPVATY